jgi:hypothetical protein
VSPSQRKRPTSGKGKSESAAGRSVSPTPLQRLGLLGFGAAFVLLFAGFAIAQGIGYPSVPSGDVALVEGVPSDIGHVSEAAYKKSFLQTAAQAGLKSIPKPGDKKYEELKTSTLSSLFDTIWIQGEAEELGISVTPKQIATQLAQIKKQNFKTEAEYKKFLKTSHFTQSDVNDRVKLQLLSTKIQQQIGNEVPVPSESQIKQYYEAAKSTQFTTPATKKTKTTKAKPAQVQPFVQVKSQISSQLTQQAQQEEFARFVANYSGKWQSRTFCASGYEIERCANFKRSGHSASAPPACYEASPKGGLPEACPAPVQLPSPQLPGSATILMPQGQRLPQRPQPAGLKPVAATTGLPGAIPPGAAPPGAAPPQTAR